MLIEPLLTQLQTLGLRGMSRALEHQQRNPEVEALPFEDRLTLLLQHEHAERQSTRLAQRLRWARLPQMACVEDIDSKTARGLERGRLTQLTDLAWVDQHLNVLLSGPTGVGKSYLACALAHQACCQDYAVRYFRVPRLTDELLSASAQQKRSVFFKLLAKADLRVLDDFGLTPLAEPFKRDLLEIVDDRFDKKSTLITSQMPVEVWHAHLDDPTLADAILDRLVHNAYQIELKGESMRKRKPLERTTKT